MAIRTLTVITPADSYDLTDLQSVRDELALTATDESRDRFLSRAISAASRSIMNHCNRVFAEEDVSEQIYFDSAEPVLRPLQLSRFPVTEIASATAGGASLTADTDYLLNATAGTLMRYSGTTAIVWDSPGTTVIQYTAGFGEVPDDVVEAALRLVTLRFKARGRDPMLMSQAGPDPADNQRFWVGTMPGQDGSFPPEIEGLLAPYLIPAFA